MKSVEKEENIGLLEDKFIASCDNCGSDFSKLFSPHNDAFKLTMDYFSLHEARNFENFSFVRKQINLFLTSNQSTSEFINKTYFFDQLENKEQKKIIEVKLLELKSSRISNNNQLFEKKIKEVFNFLYIIIWKKLKIDFNQRTWLIAKLGSGLGMGNNLVLNLKKPLYQNYKQVVAYAFLPQEIKEVIDESTIIFLSSNTIAIGYKPKIIDFPRIKPFPLDLFIRSYNYIYRFLISICLAHSYKQIIIADDLQLEFLLNAFTFDFKSFIKGIEETNIILGG